MGVNMGTKNIFCCISVSDVVTHDMMARCDVLCRPELLRQPREEDGCNVTVALFAESCAIAPAARNHKMCIGNVAFGSNGK